MTGGRPRVATERHGAVLLITMQRPERRNAIDAAMTAALDAALDELDGDPALRVGVLAGGPDAFSAGTDLRDGAGAPTDRGGEYGVVRRRRTTPLIACVEGPALGGGFELVLACDLVVASTAATFGLPEVARGVVATCGALFRAPRSLPVNVARRLLLTGDPLSAEAAHRYGLVNELAPPGAARHAALALAASVATCSPTSVRETLHAIDAVLREGDERGWAVTASAAEVVLASADHAEGVAAFLERRPPVWRGR